LNDYLIAENKYGKYAIPKSSQHRPVAQKLLRGEVHEPETIEFILNNAGDGDVIHAGTYFGDMLPALATLPNRVWAFEPNKENYNCALKTGNLNDISNIFICDFALGEFTQVSRFIENAGMSKIGRKGDTFVIVTYIDYYKWQPSLIHLDIEGYEPYALKGGIETIQKHKPVLILETVPEFIFNWGYETVDKFEGNTVLKCR